MKTSFLLLFLAVTAIAHPQTTDEWFNQKETQKKYLLQQIDALKVYIDYAEKSYTIANQGLQTVRSIKKGDYDLHSQFFSSLEQVNPAIKNWSRVADIIAIQLKIVKQVKEAVSSVSSNGQFTRDEIDYCKTVFDRLTTDCLDDIDELVLVTTTSKLEMKDDERMDRIEKVFLDIQEKYAFVSSFSNDIKVLVVQRQNEKKEIDFSKEFWK